jgi:hypothetical protein
VNVVADAPALSQQERDMTHFTLRGRVAAGFFTALGFGSIANAAIFNEGV